MPSGVKRNCLLKNMHCLQQLSITNHASQSTEPTWVCYIANPFTGNMQNSLMFVEHSYLMKTKKGTPTCRVWLMHISKYINVKWCYHFLLWGGLSVCNCQSPIFLVPPLTMQNKFCPPCERTPPDINDGPPYVTLKKSWSPLWLTEKMPPLWLSHKNLVHPKQTAPLLVKTDTVKSLIELLDR